MEITPSATPAPTEASAASAPSEAAPATPATESTAAPAVGDSTTGSESATHESSPSLLSSAAGTKPEQPAPAAEAKPDAKAGDSAPKAESVKPDDPGKTSEAKADAATDPATKDATAITPPAPVSLEDFKLPEGIKLADEPSKAFIELLNKADLDPKQRGQGLMDLYVSEVNRITGEAAQYQRDVWDKTVVGWKNDLRKDPEIGGNRLDTSLSMSKAVIEEFLTPEQATNLLRHTDDNGNGMGNFPDFIRLLHNIGRRMNVFEDSIVASNPKAPSAKGPGNRGWYDNSLNKP